jgi:predicted O-methyltransferase YrrM
MPVGSRAGVRGMSLLEKITERFGEEALHWSALEKGGEATLRALMERIKFKHKRAGGGDMRIVEIGTHYGVAACLLAEYGTVETYDITDDEFTAPVIRKFGHGRVNRTVRRLTAQEGNAWLIQYLPRQHFDLAFIDGDHEYQSVHDNFAAVQHCGRVIFHDYGTGPSFPGVRKFVDSIQTGRLHIAHPFALWEAKNA